MPRVRLLMMINAHLGRATIPNWIRSPVCAISVEFPDLSVPFRLNFARNPLAVIKPKPRSKQKKKKTARVKHLHNIFYYTKYLWLSCGGKNRATYEHRVERNALQLAKGAGKTETHTKCALWSTAKLTEQRTQNTEHTVRHNKSKSWPQQQKNLQNFCYAG